MNGSEHVLVLRSVVAPPLAGADLALGAGVHVVLGRPADGTVELVALVAGIARPRSGDVRVAGSDPNRSSATRRRIAAVLADEQLPPAEDVVDALAWALAGRKNAQQLLADAGLAAWAARRTSSLYAEERRTLALLLALGVDDAVLLVLHEPLATLLDRRYVEQRLADASRRACVLSVTSSVRDAAMLAPTALLLDNGRFTRRADPPVSLGLAPGAPPELRLHASDARRLAARLSGHNDVVAVYWDERQSSSELVVRGRDLAKLALAVAHAARDEGVRVHALSPVLPSLEAAQLATWALARAAYDNAYRAATAGAGP